MTAAGPRPDEERMVTALLMAFDVSRRAFIDRAVNRAGASPAEADRALRATLEEAEELGELVWAPCPAGVWRAARDLARVWVHESEAVRAGELLNACAATMSALSKYAAGTIANPHLSPSLSDRIGGA